MSSPTVKSTLPAAILLAGVGWFGVIYQVIYTLPTLWPRWRLFFFIVLAITGLVLPSIAFLNRRFPTNPGASRAAVVREASLVGIYAATLAWLQLGRVLNLGMAVLLVVGLIVVEFLIRLREKSRWDPGSASR
jgi:hypothetical protein